VSRDRDIWSQHFTINSTSAACEFVEALWAEDHVPPARLHGRGVGPGDLSGAPEWSSPFRRYLYSTPNETMVVINGYADGGVIHRAGPDQVHFRYPLWRALSILGRQKHDRWTRDVPRRPFHPAPVSVLLAMAGARFDPDRLMLRYSDGSRVPDEMVELFAIGAARKLRSVYQETTVGWVDRSESQQNAG
jgi:hypothetical protein